MQALVGSCLEGERKDLMAAMKRRDEHADDWITPLCCTGRLLL